MNWPNILSFSRLALLIPIIYLTLHPGNTAYLWIALALYIIAALTDFLDGWLARKLNQVSAFGIFLDPISDKIFVAALLVALVANGALAGLWLTPVIVILSREFWVSGLREYLGPKNVSLPVSRLAKWKTASQMLALGFLIIGPALPQALMAGQLLLTLAALLTLKTGLDYTRAALKAMQEA